MVFSRIWLLQPLIKFVFIYYFQRITINPVLAGGDTAKTIVGEGVGVDVRRYPD